MSETSLRLASTNPTPVQDREPLGRTKRKTPPTATPFDDIVRLRPFTVTSPSPASSRAEQTAAVSKQIDEHPSKKPRKPKKKKKKYKCGKYGYPKKYAWLANANKTYGKWGDHLKDLYRHIIEYGDMIVPFSYAPNPSLSTWVSTQRSQYKRHQQGLSSSLTPFRIAALNALGFEWIDRRKINDVVPVRFSWNERLEQLRRYKAHFGHTNVPYAPRSHRYPSLWHWTDQQRTLYRNMQQGDPEDMTEERVKALEELGFEWEDKSDPYHVGPSVDDGPSVDEPSVGEPTVDESSQEERLEEFRTHKKQNGIVNMPQHYRQNTSLADTVYSLSTAEREAELRTYKKPNGNGNSPLHFLQNTSLRQEVDNLSAVEREAALKELGFNACRIRPDRNKSWESFLEELRQYKAEHGNVNVCHHTSPLYHWCRRQRSDYQKLSRCEPTTMTLERVVALEELGFVWETRTGPASEYDEI